MCVCMCVCVCGGGGGGGGHGVGGCERAGGGGEHGTYGDATLLMLVVCGGLGHVIAMNKVLTLSIKPDPHPPEK